MREADLVGALLLAVALGGVILAFATADPKVQVFSDQGPWYLLGAAVAAVGFWCCTCAAPTRRWSRAARCGVRLPGAALLVSFFVGAALIAALVDIPLFARTTIYPDSQLMAALVLVRFLVALPGRGGRRRLPRTAALAAGAVTAVGMALRRGRLRADEPLGPRPPSSTGPPTSPLRARRPRLRPRAGAGQRRAAGRHRRRRPRRRQRAGRGRPDGRHAGRHLGADHDRAAPLLRRAGRPPARARGLRRHEPVRRVHPAAQGGRHRPGADGLPRRRGLRASWPACWRWCCSGSARTGGISARDALLRPH